MSDRFNWLEINTGERGRIAPSPRVRPHDASSFYQAARNMRESAHLAAACEYYRKAIGLNDQHYGAWCELIDTLVRNNQLDFADQVSSDAFSNYRQVRLFYAARALVLAHRRQYQEAFPLISVALEGDPGAWYPRTVMGELLLRFERENRFEAQRFFEEAIERASNPWEPYFLAGWAFLHTGMPALAASYLAEAAHFRPQAALCWLFLGDSFRALRCTNNGLLLPMRTGDRAEKRAGYRTAERMRQTQLSVGCAYSADISGGPVECRSRGTQAGS